MAIRAFNIELARIPDVVSNAMIGSMRMQFWRQTIDATFNERPPEEPVAVLLASCIAQGQRLSKHWLQRIINARDEKLSRPGFTNVTELESYAESTYSTLSYITLSAVPLNSITMDHLASHIGKAAGVTAVLRGVPLLAFPPPPNYHSNNPPNVNMPSRDRRGVVTLPLDVMSQSGVREEDIFRNGGNAEGLRDAVFDIATRASDHLITARTMLRRIQSGQGIEHEFEHQHEEGHEYSQVAPSTKQQVQEYTRGYGVIMGPAISTQLWLDRLQKVDFDVFHNSLRSQDWKLPFVAWWYNRQKRI